MQNSIAVSISDAQVEEAQHIRASRDKQYGNIYQENDTDLRYVGDLGEIVFRDELERLGCTFTWLTEDVTNQSDFWVAMGDKLLELEVKTVKRRGIPKPNYTAQITARHIEKAVDGYFFLSYEYPTQTMFFLGYSEYQFFKDNAKYFSEGEYVHDNYQIRKGHEIYNIELTKLYPAINFFKDIKSSK
jgi:hypothetical protein